MNVEQIESAVRNAPGNWAIYFRREGARWQCLLFKDCWITAAEYAALVRRLDGGDLSAQDRKRNNLQARAVESHAGGRRRGRN